MQCIVVLGKKVVTGIIQIMKVFSVNVRNYGFCPPHSDWIHWIRQKRLWWGAFCRWRPPTRSLPSCSSIRQSLNAQLPLTQYTWCELLNHGQPSNVCSSKKVWHAALEVLFGKRNPKRGSSNNRDIFLSLHSRHWDWKKPWVCELYQIKLLPGTHVSNVLYKPSWANASA